MASIIEFGKNGSRRELLHISNEETPDLSFPIRDGITLTIFLGKKSARGQIIRAGEILGELRSIGRTQKDARAGLVTVAQDKHISQK